MSAVQLALGLSLALFASSSGVLAQSVSSIEQDTATHGDIVRIFGSDLSKKTKIVFVSEGEIVKKTRLKVVEVSVAEEGEEGFVDVQIRKAIPGEFQVGVRVKKAIVSSTKDLIEIVTPSPESVDPTQAEPKDTVVAMVRDYGVGGRHVARVGTKKAKILDVIDGGPGGLSAVTFRVPKVASGVWPLSVQNGVGTGVLKNALEISGGNAKLGKATAKIDFVGKKKAFKAKKKKIATDEGGGDPGEVNIGMFSGSKKKPKVFGITIPGQLDDLAPGQLFTLADDADIVYSETGKGGTMCIWSSATNEGDEDIAIQIVAIDDEVMTLFVCGKLRLAEEVSTGECEEQVLCFSGMVTAPSVLPDDDGPGGACMNPSTATGSITGPYLSDPQTEEALFGLTPGALSVFSGTADTMGQGFPDQVINFTVSFDPANDATPATFNSVSLDGSGLTAFSLQLGFDIWGQTFANTPPPIMSSMSVTITSVENAGPNSFGILGCIRGTFTGNLRLASPELPVQSFTGDFEVPWYSTSFGG